MPSWIKQANPAYFDILAASRELSEITAEIRQHRRRIRAGDTFYYWMTGANAGIIAIGDVLSAPAILPQLDEERRFNRGDDRFDTTELRVRVRIRSLMRALPRETLLNHPILRDVGVFRRAQGTNFSLSPEQGTALEELITGWEEA